MFRAGLLLSSSGGSTLHKQQLVYVMRRQPVKITRLHQLLFIQSWSSWWWAASLLETCRGLLLK